jgi:hypothetical protein
MYLCAPLGGEEDALGLAASGGRVCACACACERRVWARAEAYACARVHPVHAHCLSCARTLTGRGACLPAPGSGAQLTVKLTVQLTVQLTHRSRCMTPSSWQWCTTSTILRKTWAAFFSLKFPASTIESNSSPPAHSSMQMCTLSRSSCVVCVRARVCACVLCHDACVVVVTHACVREACARHGARRRARCRVPRASSACSCVSSQQRACAGHGTRVRGAGLHHTPYDGHRISCVVWIVWGSYGGEIPLR